MEQIKMLTDIQMESSNIGLYTVVKKGDIAVITKVENGKIYPFYCKSIDNNEFFTAKEEEFERLSS